MVDEPVDHVGGYDGVSEPHAGSAPPPGSWPAFALCERLTIVDTYNQPVVQEGQNLLALRVRTDWHRLPEMAETWTVPDRIGEVVSQPKRLI